MAKFVSSFGEFLIRTAGFIAAVIAIGLTVGLVWKFTGGQDYVAIGVALLSVFISSFGLLLARSAWRKRALPEFLFGLMMWLAGVAFLGFNELGYWASSYEGRHELYTQLKKEEQRKEGLKDRAWQALTTGSVPASSAQLQAEIKAKKFDPVYDRAEQCSNATLPDSRKFCGELASLEASLAQALQRESLESRIVSNGGSLKSEHVDRMNVFANAEWLSRKFGGSEREWADYILLTGLAVLMLVRDMGFLVAFPLGKRKEAATAPKEVTVTTIAEPVTKPASTSTARPDLAREIPADRQKLSLPTREIVASPKDALQLSHPPIKPDPNGKGTPGRKVRAQHEGFTTKDGSEKVIFPPEFNKDDLPTKADFKGQRYNQKSKKHSNTGSVTVWLADCTSQVTDLKIKPASTDCHRNYIAWCQQAGLHPLPLRKFTRVLTAQLRLKNPKRNVNGQRLFPGLALCDVAQFEKRKVA